MATGWAGDGAVQEQIDATVKDAITRVQSQLPQGPSLTHCAECDAEIPEARRAAVRGVRLCVQLPKRARSADRASSAVTIVAAAVKDSQLR